MIKNSYTTAFRMIAGDVSHQGTGCLIPLEAEREIPFPIKRIYYIFGVDRSVRRGFHSHRDLEQMLICVHGSVKIDVKNPLEQETVVLDTAQKGLYIGPMIWREMHDFSSDAVLLVLASHPYDENDYIRDYAKYQQEAIIYFKQNDHAQ